jgi:hypothetical protein
MVADQRSLESAGHGCGRRVGRLEELPAGAAELIRLYAARQAVPGFAFGPNIREAAGTLRGLAEGTVASLGVVASVCSKYGGVGLRQPQAVWPRIPESST